VAAKLESAQKKKEGKGSGDIGTHVQKRNERREERKERERAKGDNSETIKRKRPLKTTNNDNDKQTKGDSTHTTLGLQLSSRFHQRVNAGSVTLVSSIVKRSAAMLNGHSHVGVLGNQKQRTSGDFVLEEEAG